MSENNLNDRFPEMKPINSPPTLSTINGIGTTVYGQRDYDDMTQSYVVTHWIVVLFIPIFAIGAYRVITASSGWYFLGKVPLSTSIKMWNRFLVLSIFVGISYFVWHSYTHTPEALARAKMAEAKRLLDDGNVSEAAAKYAEVVRGSTSEKGNAKAQLKDLVANHLQDADSKEVAQVLTIGAELRLPAIGETGLKLAKDRAKSNGRGALVILKAVEPIMFGQLGKDVQTQRRDILEEIVKKSPDDFEAITELAMAYDDLGQRNKCEFLLEPHKDKLGTTRAALILGRIYFDRNKDEEALKLLHPYVKAHLSSFQTSFDGYKQTLSSVENRNLTSLKSGKASDFDYAKYKSSSKAEQTKMVNDYLDKKLKNDPAVKNALKKIREHNSVVPAALDVGLLLLRRGQMASDEKARKADLEEAEKTFLAIRSAAGKNEQYQLSLGQVYYWLGKHAKGKTIFNQLLRGNGKNSQTLVSLSRAYRELGEIDEARSLAEEGYEKALMDNDKYLAAMQRALLFTSTDDQIQWLERCNLNVPSTKAEMHTARGNKAMTENNRDRAIKEFRQAIAIQETLPDSSTNLNNNGLNYLSLYRAAGKREYLDKGLAQLERAIALEPSNSILLANVADTMLETAVRDVIGDAIKLERIRQKASLRVLSYLCKNQKEQAALNAKLLDHVCFKKARRFYENLIIVSPKSFTGYNNLLAIYDRARDTRGLQNLEKRLASSNVPRHPNRANNPFRKNDPKWAELVRKTAKNDEATVAEARKLKGATLALNVSYLANDKLVLEYFEKKDYADEIVRLAEEAHNASPSIGTRGGLVAALLNRTSRDLRSANEAYHKLADKCGQSVNSTYLIAYVLSYDNPMQKDILAHADVRRVQDLLKQRMQSTPGDNSPWLWVMMRHIDEQEADEMAVRFRFNKHLHAKHNVERKLNSVSSTFAIEAYWESQITGETATAEQLWQNAVRNNVQMPTEKFPMNAK